MGGYTENELWAMYEYVSLEGDKHTFLKQMFALLLIDNILPPEKLFARLEFKDFVIEYTRQFEHLPEIQQDPAGFKTHNQHHLENIFTQLSKKTVYTSNWQNCPIRLANSSGMVQYHSKLDLFGVHSFLDDMCVDTKINVLYVMDEIKEKLVKLGVYDKNDNYRLSLHIGSDEYLYVSVAHDTKIFESGTDAFYQALTSDFKDILTIIENNGYLSEENTIKSSFTTILGSEPEVDNEDENSELSI